MKKIGLKYIYLVLTVVLCAVSLITGVYCATFIQFEINGSVHYTAPEKSGYEVTINYSSEGAKDQSSYFFFAINQSSNFYTHNAISGGSSITILDVTHIQFRYSTADYGKWPDAGNGDISIKAPPAVRSGLYVNVDGYPQESISNGNSGMIYEITSNITISLYAAMNGGFDK